jgi:AcrR family transcriptional regulator
MAKAIVKSDESVPLRNRIIEAASKVFAEEGYESLSMRRVAQEAGCSQMAMYRHFANKEALTQHICTEVYSRFTAKMRREIDLERDPWQQLRRFIAALIKFAVAFPDHYGLIFLVRHPNPTVSEEREQLGQRFIEEMQGTVKALLPPETSAEQARRVLRQMLCSLHGTAGLLIAHPKAYGLSKQRAIEDAELTVQSLLHLGPI